MSLPTHTLHRKDALARALLLVFAFSSWSLTAPANIALALMSILWLSEVPRHWRALIREPAIMLTVITLVIILLLTWRATILFPTTASEQWHGFGGWTAPLLFIVIAWWLRRDPQLIMPMLVAAFLGLIFGVLRKTDWALAPEFLQGMRYHFGAAALGLSFIASVALTGLLIFRRRIVEFKIKERAWPALGWVLWGLGCCLLLAILIITQSRGAALILALASIVYGLLRWRLIAPTHKQPDGFFDPHRFAILALFLSSLFLFWSMQGRNLADWQELTTPSQVPATTTIEQMAQPTGTMPDKELSYVGSTAVRLNLIEVGLTAFVHRPWLGFGPGTSTTEFLVPQHIIPVRPHHLHHAPNWSHLHSVPLEILARFGLVGVLIALSLGWLVWRAYRQLWQDPRATPDLRVFLTLSGAMLLFYFVYDFRLVNVDIRFFIIQLLGIIYSFSLGTPSSPGQSGKPFPWRKEEQAPPQRNGGGAPTSITALD